MGERIYDRATSEGVRYQLAEFIKERGYDDPEVARRYYEFYGRNGLEPRIAHYFEKILDETLPQEGVIVDSEKKPLSDCAVLDLGSGPGITSEILQDRFAKVVAVDKAPAMVDFINQKHPLKDEIDARQGDFAEQLPLKDQSVEVVVSFNTIDELQPEDEDNFLREIARVVKPGGFALINQIVNASKLSMRREFHQRRQDEIDRHDPDVPRHYVFLSSELESRLNNLLAEEGIEAKVEIFSDSHDRRYCIAKINFDKIDQENEA